ncbi:MAG: NAD(P)-dependent oxidoreductase [Acidobacteria bacterium]|jgi:nucleoside-diphosphate-sugar epimerase|nr:NAD(P)-dependent oxidoreductase [Acidobacteriota bacterium]
MKIFIAGASGTLGMPLVRELIKRKHEVYGLTRSGDKKVLLEIMGAKVVVADALKADEIKQAMQSVKPDCVVNLLTAIPKNGAMRAADLKATNLLRVKGTQNLLAAAIAAGAKRFVAESMIFVYGLTHTDNKLLTEQFELSTREEKAWLQEIVDAIRSLEAQISKADKEGLIESTALRYGLLYGSESPSTRYMFDMLKKRFLPTASGAKGITAFVHLDDAVSATVAAIEREKVAAVYNVVDDEPVKMNDWITYAAEVLKAKKPFSMPVWLLGLLSPFTATILNARVAVSNDKAKRELGWQLKYPDYRQGLRQAALLGK